MSDYQIPASTKRRAIEAHDEAADQGQLFDDCMEEALRAALDDLGMETVYTMKGQHAKLVGTDWTHYRFVSRWMPSGGAMSEKPRTPSLHIRMMEARDRPMPLRCKLRFHKIKQGWGWEGPECERCGRDVVENVGGCRHRPPLP